MQKCSKLEIVDKVYNNILHLCPLITKEKIEGSLRNLLETINKSDFKIDIVFVKDVMKSFFDLSTYSIKNDKLLLLTIESAVKAGDCP